MCIVYHVVVGFAVGGNWGEVTEDLLYSTLEKYENCADI